MDFNTLIFLGFFAGTAVVYYALPRMFKPLFLLAASYCFYLYKPENARLVTLLISATVITWCSGLAIAASRKLWVRRLFLCIAALTCGGILFFYKYFNFFNSVLWSERATLLDLSAPLGLSYFTFQSLSYTLDIYQKKLNPEKNFLYYALFVSFFPCIFTGPIERAGHLLPQFHRPRRFSYQGVSGGAFRMLWGYVKKMVIADNLDVFISAVYGSANQMDGPMLAAASLLFSLRLYMDFSGACDIAIGGARVLGYELLENFRSPFAATSFVDLWRRWHMSLTGWFRDYIYFPLGGSRCAPLRHYANLLLVFVVSGLWHGAAWGYLLWGLSCGLVQLAGRFTLPARHRLADRNPLCRSGLFRLWWQRGIVYILFSLCFIFFACALYGTDTAVVYGGLLNGWADFFRDPALFAGAAAGLGLGGVTGLVLLLLIPIVLTVEGQGRVSDWIRRQNWALRWTLYYGLAAALLFFGAFGQSAFIYQQY